MSFSALWIVFSLSFVVALSGALMPGPLLTYTIARTVRTPRRGWTVGPRAIAGHAALEAVILFGLLLGVMDLFRDPLAIRIIGTAGGAFLIWSGVMMIVELVRGRARAGSLETREPARESPLSRLGPVASGVLVSLSNPYWWVWWVTVGAASLVRFDVTFQRWPAILAFYLGHEAGDLSWYATVSTLVHVGRRGVPKVAYDVLLIVCAVAIVGFGAWLGISAYT